MESARDEYDVVQFTGYMSHHITFL